MSNLRMTQRLRDYGLAYHPIVHTLLLGTILARAASSMSLPFLSIYLMKHTAMSPGLIGMIIGAGALAGTVGGFVGGALSDLFGRRRILLGALLGWCVVFFGFAAAKTALPFLALSLLNGLCRSFYEPVSQALMSDLTDKRLRMRVFNLRYLAINIGVSVGPLLGALFAAMGGTLPFLVTGFLYLAYAVMLYVLLNRFGIRRIEGEARAGTSFLSAWHAVRRDVALRHYLLGGVVTAIGYSQMTVTLSQYVEGRFTEGVALFAVMMSVNAVTVVALQIPISRWAGRFSAMTTLTIGVLFYALGDVGFAFSSSWAAFLLSMVVFTLGEILTFPTANLLVDRIAPESLRGAYYGAQSFGSLGQFIGPWIGGLLLGWYDGTTLFLTMAVVAVGAIGFYRAGEAARLRRTAAVASRESLPM